MSSGILLKNSTVILTTGKMAVPKTVPTCRLNGHMMSPYTRDLKPEMALRSLLNEKVVVAVCPTMSYGRRANRQKNLPWAGPPERRHFRRKKLKELPELDEDNGNARRQ